MPRISLSVAPLQVLPTASSSLRQTTTVRRCLHSSFALRDQPKPSVPVQHIAALRKIRPVPMSLAREALANSNNDVDKALAYLDKQMASSAAKAAKVSGRSTNEGTIAVSLLSGKRVSMIHLGCETDFVARNDVFLKTAKGVASTAAFLDVPSENGEQHAPKAGQDPILSFPPEALLSAPLITLPSSSPSITSDSIDTPIPTSDPTTIQQSLLTALGSTGENLKLLRAATFAAPFPSSTNVRYVPGCYAHGGPNDTEGRIGAMIVLSVTSQDAEKPIATLIHGAGGDELDAALLKLSRTIARQVVGFPTRVVSRKGEKDKELDEGEVLFEQPFMMMGEERKVGEVLEEWGAERGVKVKIVGMRRWSVSDPLEVKQELPETEDGA